MTSSLVGSEMCIRDRPCPTHPCTRSGNIGTHDELISVICRTHGSSLPRPVSYTHLTLPTICSV
eukprot:5578857-Prorocentrum_lima.AAC.1